MGPFLFLTIKTLLKPILSEIFTKLTVFNTSNFTHHFAGRVPVTSALALFQPRLANTIDCCLSVLYGGHWGQSVRRSFWHDSAVNQKPA